MSVGVFEYRISEGVILRRSVEHPARVEAWAPWWEGKAWYVYSTIDRDWGTSSRRLPEFEVPDDARSAPSSYRDGKNELLSSG